MQRGFKSQKSKNMIHKFKENIVNIPTHCRDAAVWVCIIIDQSVAFSL